jgi:hypothetical protein
LLCVWNRGQGSVAGFRADDEGKLGTLGQTQTERCENQPPMLKRIALLVILADPCECASSSQVYDRQLGLSEQLVQSLEIVPL